MISRQRYGVCRVLTCATGRVLRAGVTVACAFAVLASMAHRVHGGDFVDFEQDGEKHQLTGEVVVEAKDGGLLFRGRDGRLWMIQPDEINSRRSDEEPVEPLTADELAAQVEATMPDGFKIHRTAHYVICYDTSDAFAEWVGALYERLYRGFFTYWKNRRVELDEPEMPMVVLVFHDKESYTRHVQRELGSDPGSMIGYYHMLSNHVTMFDLTGTQATPSGSRIRTAAEVNRILSQPRAAAMVATIVHEATHQLAFNSGLQTRFADLPFWLSEGLAIYFETPDLKSRRGWRGIGNVNRVRLVQFKRYATNRPPDSLTTLLTDDSRFRDPDQLLDAYAEAWALNFFLLSRYRDEYVAYVESLAAKQPLVEFSGEERLAEFKQFFGEDLAELDRAFVRFIMRLN